MCQMPARIRPCVSVPRIGVHPGWYPASTGRVGRCLASVMTLGGCWWLWVSLRPRGYRTTTLRTATSLPARSTRSR